MTPEELRKLYGPPSQRAVEKVLTSLDKHCIDFINNSSFLILATSDNVSIDLSPKGDPKGFVRVIDQNTIEVPDRPGNNRIDGLLNISANSQVALLFFILNVNETLKIQGRAEIIADKAFTSQHKINNKIPKTITRIQINSAGIHCGKALIRSSFWKPDNWPKKRPIESLYNIIEDQTGLQSLASNEEATKKIYKKKFY